MKVLQQIALISSLFLLSPALGLAGDIDFSGDIRLRYEQVDSGSLGIGAGITGNWITQRTRLAIKAKPKSNLEFFLQLQDVRTWGGEDHSYPPPSVSDTGTDASANAWDMHQGYFILKQFLTETTELKLGRQEVVLDDARLVGNIGWIQNAQAFDAIRLTYKNEILKLDVITAQVAANDTHPVLLIYLPQAPMNHVNDSFFHAIHAEFKVGEGVISPFLYVADRPSRAIDNIGTVVGFRKLETMGLYIKQKIVGINLKLQLGTQTGKVTDIKNHDASFYAFSIGDKFWDIQMNLGKDHYSGDKVNAGPESNTFNHLYATNHAYFGFMDKFLFTPTQGIADTHFKMVKAFQKKSKLIVHYHMFATASGSYDPNQTIGSEIDVTYKLKANDVDWQFGLSQFSSGNTVNYGTTGSTAVDGTWAYVQLLAKF